MPVAKRRRRNPPLDFKCGRQGILTHGKREVEVGPSVYTLAVYLVHQRAVSLRAVKVRLWGSEGEAHPDNTVSQLGQRLNKKLSDLGSEVRVMIADKRVRLGTLARRGRAST